MAYIHRNFNKKDIVNSSRRPYEIRPSSRGSVLPRYVASYQYSIPETDLGNSTNKIFTSEVNTDNTNKQQCIEEYPRNVGQSMMLQRIDEGISTNINIIAKVIAPSGTVQYCKVIDFDSSHFNIQFVPREIGKHRVSVKSGNIHVPGSPFNFYVENIESVGSSNIQVSGKGIESGYTEEENEFSIFAAGTNPGILSVRIDGPSKATISINDTKQGIYLVKYTIHQKGDYLCSITLNDDPILGSPFNMIIEDRVIALQTQNMTRTPIQDPGILLGQRTTLTIKCRALNGGLMKAYIISPSNQEENVKIEHLGGDQFSLQIEPKESGPHRIHVLIDDKHIYGSPFELQVGDMKSLGNGFSDEYIDEMNHLMIDRQHANQAPLANNVGGRKKVELDYCQSKQGYELAPIPWLQGEHINTNNYGDNNPGKGSSVKVNVIGDIQKHRLLQKSQFIGSISPALLSYPQNIECQGEGIYRAFIDRNNQFIVDASTGGAGVLFVEITGPSSHCDEIKVKHVGGKIFQVNYKIQEYGSHFIIVRWGEKNIPGSPFKVLAQ